MKRVYTCFCTDVIHEGHLNIIHEARKYGEVVVGVLSDAAMIRFNRFPTVSFEERVQLVKDIPEVSNVVIQNDVMYDEVVAELHPDYVIHGDNWLHETVGGMPTVASKIDLVAIAKACGYPNAVSVDNFKDLDDELEAAKSRNELSFIEAKCSIGARDNLGRPTTTALENKINFMEYLKTL